MRFLRRRLERLETAEASGELTDAQLLAYLRENIEAAVLIRRTLYPEREPDPQPPGQRFNPADIRFSPADRAALQRSIRQSEWERSHRPARDPDEEQQRREHRKSFRALFSDKPAALALLDVIDPIDPKE